MRKEVAKAASRLRGNCQRLCGVDARRTFLLRPSKQSKMIGILSLKRTYQEFKFGKLTNVLKAWVFKEKRPTRESSANAPLKPLETGSPSPRERVNAGNLVIGVMGMPEGFRTRTGPGYAPQGLFDVAGQCMQHALEAYDQRLIRQAL